MHRVLPPTADGLRRVAWAMGEGADILIIALGGNDGLRGVPLDETKKNLLGTVAKARTKNTGIKVLIPSMEKRDNLCKDFTARFQAVFPSAAKQFKSTCPS